MSPRAALASGALVSLATKRLVNEVAPARWWMLVLWDHPAVGDPETSVAFGYTRSRAVGVSTRVEGPCGQAWSGQQRWV